MTRDGWAGFLEIHRRQILDEKDGMRIADIDGHRIAQRAGANAEMQRIRRLSQGNAPPIEADLSHVDADRPSVRRLGVEDARRGLYSGVRTIGLAHHHRRHAARGVAARANLAAVGVADAHGNVGARIAGRLDDDQLIAANARMPIRQFAHLSGGKRNAPPARIDDDEVVAETMHFDEGKRFHGRDLYGVNRAEVYRAAAPCVRGGPWAARNARM